MWHSLGKVTISTSGVPARATANQTTPASRYACHSIRFTQIPGNTGKIYVMDSNTPINTTTYAGCLAILAVPTSLSLPGSAATITSAPAAINAADFWLDAEVSGESCLVSATRA